MSAVTRSLVSLGSDGLCIDIECHLSNNLPTILIVGFASKAVNEAKDRLRGAFASSQLELPRRRITINLAPADIPKTDSGLDLAIAASILCASQQVMPLPPNQLLIGELGLDGSARAVRGIIGKLLSGRALGITEYFIPLANVSQAQLVPGLKLFPVRSLIELYAHLAGTRDIIPIDTKSGIYDDVPIEPRLNQPDFDDVVGQTLAKRALTIAAAGGHNVFLSGPPGTGKSMLAKALPGLLPPLNHEEILEVTHLQSLASNNYERLYAERPMRSPHHSASHVAMIGGGAGVRPGEISLSHRGVLFLDELPEFNRPTLEALRQPLEDRIISVARIKDSVDYPANFILVATANPCPCGYHGSEGHTCVCLPAQIQHYKNRLSGPILDRIDLCCNVHEVDHTKLLKSVPSDSSIALRASIVSARNIQAERYASPIKLNSDLTNRELRQFAKPSRSASSILNMAAAQLNLSARAYMRIIKVARTIADLEASPVIEAPHMSEALAYRQRTVA